MASFSRLPRRLYLDTQFMFAYLVPTDEDHAAAETVARAIRELWDAGLVRAYVSVLVLDELTWSLAGVLNDGDCGPGSWRRSPHTEKSHEFSARRASIAGYVRSLLSEPWLSIAPLGKAEALLLPDLLTRYDLRPRDTCHLACAIHNNIGAILTNDSDFHRLSDLPVGILSYSEETD